MNSPFFRLCLLLHLFQGLAELDRAIGTPARVTEDIDNEAGTGAVYVDGKTWTARSSDGSVIPIGTKVTVERMEGVKLFVTPERTPCGTK